MEEKKERSEIVKEEIRKKLEKFFVPELKARNHTVIVPKSISDGKEGFAIVREADERASKSLAIFFYSDSGKYDELAYWLTAKKADEISKMFNIAISRENKNLKQASHIAHRRGNDGRRKERTGSSKEN